VATINYKVAGIAVTSAQIADFTTAVSAMVDPGVSSEPIGRRMTNADNGKTLRYTGAGAASFLLGADLVQPFSTEVSRAPGAGVPTFTADTANGVTLNVATGKSASVANVNDRTAVQLMTGLIFEVI
jgi:hypothetical protein